MDKSFSYSMYGDKSILVVGTVCDVLYIHGLHDCNNEFVIISD